MNTCDTCKWWDQSEDSFQFRPIQGKCTNQKVTGSDAKTTQDNVLMHGGWAELWTGPKFGCIHHEAK